MIALRSTLAGATLLVAAGLTAGTLSAQSLWTNPGAGASLQLEILRPDFRPEELAFGGATGAGFVTAHVPLAGAWTLVADLPFSRAAWDAPDGAGSSTLVGNPYVGVEWQSAGRLTAGLGVRAPVGDRDDADKLGPILVGISGELERMEAFLPETLGLYAAAAYRAPLSGPLSLRLRGGTAFLTGDGGSDDLLLGYTGQLRYASGALDARGGLTGRANVTTDDEDADRTSHQVVLAADYGIGPVRPGLQLRLPLDGDVRDVTGFTVGIGLGYALR